MCISCAQSGITIAESVGLEPNISKGLALGISAIMLFSLAAPLAAPATTVKSGAVCAKANQKIIKAGKTFVCKKSGKKLVWRIEKKTKPTVSVAQPEPQPTPVIKYMEPWATEIDTKIMVDTALRNFSEWVEKNKGNELNHKVFIQEGTNPLFAKMINDVESLAAQMLSKYVPGGTIKVIGKDADWIINTLRSNNRVVGTNKVESLKSPSTNGRAYHYEMSHSDWTAYLIYSQGDINRSDFGQMALPAHEYFHLVQAGLRGPIAAQGGRSGHPASTMHNWFHEGSADFFGHATAAYLFKTNFNDARNTALTRYKPPNTDESLPLKSYEPGPESSNWKYPYNVGRTAVEYIVASIGFEPILQLQRDFRTAQDFNTAFRSSIGMSIDEFYAKFKIIRSKVGLPAER
jgi:hypothetical protein